MIDTDNTTKVQKSLMTRVLDKVLPALILLPVVGLALGTFVYAQNTAGKSTTLAWQTSSAGVPVRWTCDPTIVVYVDLASAPADSKDDVLWAVNELDSLVPLTFDVVFTPGAVHSSGITVTWVEGAAPADDLADGASQVFVNNTTGAIQAASVTIELARVVGMDAGHASSNTQAVLLLHELLHSIGAAHTDGDTDDLMSPHPDSDLSPEVSSVVLAAINSQYAVCTR